MEQSSIVSLYDCVQQLERFCSITGTISKTGLDEIFVSVEGAKMGINQVIIRSDRNGTYSMTFCRFERLETTVIETVKGVFVDRLLPVFESCTDLSVSKIDTAKIKILNTAGSSTHLSS